MTALWEEGADPVVALGAFLDGVPREVISTPGNRAGIGSVFLMGVDADRYPPYRPTPLQRAYALTGSDKEERDPADRYRRALAFFDRMIEDGPSVGLELRDRLDAQAVTWWLTSDDPPPADWHEEDKRGLALFRGLLGGTPGPSLSEEDFEVLGHNADGRSWTAITDEDQGSLRALRGKLQELAGLLSERLPSEVALQPFTSILNPSGRAPKFYWICAYPADSKNKSYAYQLFVIVHPEWIEVGFGSGSADSQLQDADLEADLRVEMARARAALAAIKGAPWTTGLERRARLVGHDFRRRWLEPEGRLLTGIETWLDTSGEPGVAVSTFLSPEEVISLGDGLTSRLIKLLDPLVPLLEAAYVREEEVPVDHDSEETLTVDGLAEQLYLEPAYLEDVLWLLEDKRQLVFYGPPGTGKTFVAEALAHWYAGDPSRVETVQFHPSYAYEDFIEGIRPVLESKEVRYTLGEGGLLKRFARRAAEDPDQRPHVIVIDEINRANLARVFGELLYLLEYRKREVTLPYSGEAFRLPENLFLIGTMNTADRSIALVDFALRRRFHFVRFDPDVEILRRWLVKYEQPTEAAELLDWLNGQIGDHDFAIGFSYFMRADLSDEDVLRRVWERSIMPALEEFYFDDQDKRERFGLDRVRAAIRPPASPDDIPSLTEGPEVSEEEAPGV